MSFLRNDVLISVPPGPVVNPVPPFVDITLARGLFPSPVKHCTHPPHSLGSASGTLQADTMSINNTAAVEPRACAASGLQSAAVEPSLDPKNGQALVDSTNHTASGDPGAVSIIQGTTVKSAKEDNLISGWPVGSTPYFESLQYQRFLHSIAPRVPRPLSQMCIDPKDSDAGERFLAAVKAGPPPSPPNRSTGSCMMDLKELEAGFYPWQPSIFGQQWTILSFPHLSSWSNVLSHPGHSRGSSSFDS